MSTEELRRELDRAAASAPVVEVPEDTWPRARRSVVRDRVVLVGASLAVVAAIALGVTWLPDRAQPPVAGSSAGAIPSRIWTLPEGEDLPVADDLAIGPVGAVYVTTDSAENARLVAVSGTDGSYRTLRLPGPDREDAVGFGWTDQVFQLAPDGRQLAYSFFPGNGDSGVGIVDLMTGEVRIVRPDLGSRGFVRGVIWSPGGDYLVWWGQPHSSQGFGDTEAGLIAPGAKTSTTLPREPQDQTRGYAVDDGGRVALIDPARVRIWQDGQILDTRAVDMLSTPSRAAQLVGPDLVEVRSRYLDVEAGETETSMVRHSAGTLRTGPLPDTFAHRMTVLGWTSSGAAVVQADPAMGKASEPDLYRVELDDDGVATPERIVTLDSGNPPDRLTVATDLPVEERPAPEWAEEPWWGIDPSLLIGLGVAAAIAVLMGLRWGWRRYRAARYAS